MNRPFFTVSELARLIGLAPRIISDLFYKRKLDDSKCPVISGRRIIPREYVIEIDRVLREAGLIAEGDLNLLQLVEDVSGSPVQSA